MPHRDSPGLSADDLPFAGLTPDFILDALDSVGFRGDGRMLQLNSYENRVFQVFLEDRSAVVAKFYRPHRWSDEQILEEHGFCAELAQAEIPVVAPLTLQVDPAMPMHPVLCGVPPTLATFERSGLAPHRLGVSPCRAGRAPSLESNDILAWIGRFIGRMHAIGALRPFAHRRTLSPDELGRKPRDWLRAHDLVPPDALPGWLRASDRVLDLIDEGFERAGKVRTIRLHGDCHIGNLLWTDAGPHFVDLDDAMNGPAMQDLWMLLHSDAMDQRMQLNALLTGYEAFMDFDDREIALIEPLRALRLIYHSAWIAQRWTDPAFQAAFPWFGGSAYWQQQTQVLDEQARAMTQDAA